MVVKLRAPRLQRIWRANIMLTFNKLFPSLFVFAQTDAAVLFLFFFCSRGSNNFLAQKASNTEATGLWLDNRSGFWTRKQAWKNAHYFGLWSCFVWQTHTCMRACTHAHTNPLPSFQVCLISHCRVIAALRLFRCSDFQRTWRFAFEAASS